jgi:hypothetical protein
MIPVATAATPSQGRRIPAHTTVPAKKARMLAHPRIRPSTKPSDSVGIAPAGVERFTLIVAKRV